MEFLRETRLYCGADRADGVAVSEGEFKDFLRRAVVPEFPGFTIERHVGYWEGEPEVCRVIVVLHNLDSVRRLDRIALAYCVAFDQSSVLRSTSEVRARLVGIPEPLPGERKL